MIKLPQLGLAAALLLAAIGGARAESILACRGEQEILPDGTVSTRVTAERAQYETLLRQQGYNVDYVEDWGGCVKAVIDNPDGSSTIMFFDPDTLRRLTTN